MQSKLSVFPPFLAGPAEVGLISCPPSAISNFACWQQLPSSVAMLSGAISSGSCQPMSGAV